MSEEDVAAEKFLQHMHPKQGYIVLGAFKSPGVATVLSSGSPRTWNKIPSHGMDGATSVYMGGGLAPIVVQIKLWTALHFVEWDVFARAALAKPINAAPLSGAIDILHPVLNRPPWNIKAVCVEDVTPFIQSDTGLWTCEIHFSEYRAQKKPAMTRPIASIPAAEVQMPTAQDAAEVEMKRLAAIAQGLGG